MEKKEEFSVEAKKASQENRVCRFCEALLVPVDTGWECPNKDCKDKRWPSKKEGVK